MKAGHAPPADFSAAPAPSAPPCGSGSRHSVQDRFYRMEEAAPVAAPAIIEITLAMPIVHYLAVDLSAFGRDGPGGAQPSVGRGR